MVHGGSYAMKHFATDNKGYTISQVVPNITAETVYTFRGWVNIPSTSDAFTFKIDVQWRNAKNRTLGTSTIRTFNTATIGWNEATASLTAPVGTTNAEVRMVVSSLNATVYVDDFAFRP